MFKGTTTQEVYEQHLSIGLCDKHKKKLDLEINLGDNYELQRKAFLYIRLRILDPIIFGKPFIFEKMKTLVSKSDYFSMCNQNFDEISDKTHFIDTVLLLDSIVVFTLCHFSKICCGGCLFQNEEELELCCSPDANFIQKLLNSKNVTESDISHFNPILQDNFKGYDKSFIKFCYVIALLFVRNTAVKVKLKQALTELSADLVIVPESSNCLEIAKVAESNKNYVEAIKAYISALKYNPYSVVSLSHRAAVYLNINELKLAQLDSYISVIIDPSLIQGYKILILSLGHQYNFEESYQTLQYALSKCKQAQVEEYEELVEIENLMKENIKQQENCNISEKLKNEEIKEKLEEIKLEDVPDLSDASKSDDEDYSEENLNEKISKYTEICKCLKEGSQSLLKDCGTLAIRHFGEAMDMIKNYPEVSNFEECELVVLKYAFGLAFCSSGGHEDLQKSICLFKEIIEDHSAITFPAVYYGMGLAYYKLNRFKDSLKYLKIVEDILEKCIHFKVYAWPGLSDVISETKPHCLKLLVESMIKDCEMPPSPDAICRFENCTFHPSIYYKDPDFKGFFTLHCSEQCLLQYHPHCWKALKNVKRYSDKEFLEKNCFTPDCAGIIVKVENINKEGNIEKMFDVVQAKKPTKQKKTKITKKADLKEDKRRKRQNSKDSETDKPSKLLENSSVGDISKETTLESEDLEINKNGNSIISNLPSSGNAEPYIIIKKEKNVDENCFKIPYKAKETKKVKACTKSFTEFYTNSHDQTRNESGALEELSNDIPACNQYSDLEDEFSDKINDFEAVKSNLYNYLEDFLIKNGPLSINDARLIAEIETFPTEANIVLAKFGGVAEFLKRDTEHRFGIVDDSYLCSRVDLADAYKLSRNSVSACTDVLTEPFGSQHCELNPDAKEYTPTSSTSASSNSFVSITEEYSLSMGTEKCNSPSMISAISKLRLPHTMTTQPIRNLQKNDKAIQTDQLFKKSVGTIKTDQELIRLIDRVDLLMKEKEDLTIEKTLAETRLATEMKSVSIQHKDAINEIECLKKELQDSNQIIKSQKKEHKNLESEHNLLTESMNKIVEENIQQKKEINVLLSSNKSLLESLKKVEIRLESLKKEYEMLGKSLDQKVENVGNLNNALTKRAKNAELHLLEFKKQVYFKKIDDKVLEADQRIKEIEMYLPIVNSNSLYKSNLEALINEIRSYETKLNEIRLNFQIHIDEQVNSVNNGVLLESLTPIEMKNLPEIPSFSTQLLPTNTAANSQSQLWNSQFLQTINSSYCGKQVKVSSVANTNSVFTTELPKTNIQCQKNISNTSQIKNCANSELIYQTVPPGIVNLNTVTVYPKSNCTLTKSLQATNVDQKPSNSATSYELKELSVEPLIPPEPSKDKSFNGIKETLTDSTVSSNSSAMYKNLLHSSSSTVEAKEHCNNLSLELEYNIKKKRDLEKSQSSISVQAKASGNSYEKLLQKLKVKYPLHEESQLMQHIKEFRTKRKGGLSGLSIETIVSNVGALIDSKSAQIKKGETSAKNHSIQSKMLINKKITSEVKEEKSAPPQKFCPWGFSGNSSENKWSGTNLEEGCVICFEDLSQFDAYKVDCGHYFHLKCIREWLNKKSDCPICRVHLLLPEDYPVLS